MSHHHTRTTRDRRAASGVLSGVAFVAGVGAGMARSARPFPRPGAQPAEIRAFFGQEPSPMRLMGPAQLVSAAALGRFAGSVAALARRSGSPALGRAAAAGGAVAAGSLAVAAGKGIGLARGAADDPDRARRLHRRMFVAGGPVHGAGLGVLLAALGLAARRGRELPRPLATAALAAAVPNLLAPLSLAAPRAVALVPAGRFPGLVVIGVAGARLARGG